jgi:hypothetical protein
MKILTALVFVATSVMASIAEGETLAVFTSSTSLLRQTNSSSVLGVPVCEQMFVTSFENLSRHVTGYSAPDILTFRNRPRVL